MTTPTSPVERRELGKTGIFVSPVALGCWPIAGMTSLDVNDQDSLATLQATLDSGINFLDTAYCYGAFGESEKLIAEAIRGRREKVVIATKGGLHWKSPTERAYDGTPQKLIAECHESLARLGTDYIDLLYLHASDPKTPVEISAEAYVALKSEGKIRAVGVSNLTLEQLQKFAAVCPVDAIQPPYNMLQREIENDLLPYCLEHSIAVCVYWPLMKGLLAGKLPRDYVFRPGDGRAKYPMFQGDEWLKNQDFLDELRVIAAECGKTVAQLVVNWTIHQPGITVALCGAKRPDQIVETAGSMGWSLSASQIERIETALARRGLPLTRGAV